MPVKQLLRERFPTLLGVSAALCILQGCGSVQGIDQPFSLTPATKLISPGQQITIRPIGLADGESCTWTSSDADVLPHLNEGTFVAQREGNVTVTALCAAKSAKTTVSVQNSPGQPMVITTGGTYSGNFSSADSNTPAVTITTDDPVTLKNSVVSGKGNLIVVQGASTGAHVTIKNVTGTALDPGVYGRMRGEFVRASKLSSLVVDHCTMSGVSFGVEVLSSTVSKLKITNNAGSDLEDRESNGAGGLLPVRGNLGHFIILNRIVAPNGAEIGWNQLVNTIGSTSTEDVVNIFKTAGATGNPILVHDNYAEGFSSPATSSYTGSGFVADGDTSLPVTAYVTFRNNVVVHAAGSGVAIASGHDITAAGNRVVSCGQDAHQQWFAMPFAQAALIWNYLNAPNFGNNQITGTTGGLVRPDAHDLPMAADSWAPAVTADVFIRSSGFTDPCLVKKQLNLAAEDVERTAWANRLASNNQTEGAQP